MVVGGRDGSVASRGRLKSFVMCAKRDPIKMSKAPITKSIFVLERFSFKIALAVTEGPHCSSKSIGTRN